MMVRKKYAFPEDAAVKGQLFTETEPSQHCLVDVKCLQTQCLKNPFSVISDLICCSFK